jgi:type I restriction enzyme S subunit
MEAIGETGELDLSSERELEEVRTGYSVFKDGDVVVAKITPCFENGKGAVIHGTLSGIGFGTTELHVLTPGPELDPRFLYYLAMSPEFRGRGAAMMTGAAGQQRVPEDFIRDFPVALSSLSQQRQVVNFLDQELSRLDCLLAAKQRLLTLLAEKRKAIIASAITRGIDPTVELRDSGVPWLGEIPAHWETQRRKFHLQRIEQGWSPQCETVPAGPDDWGVLKVGCVNGDTFNPEENKRLPDTETPSPDLEICPGDVLVSRANTTELLGSAAIVNDVRPKLLLSDKLYRLVVDATALMKEFLVLYLRSASGRFDLERTATGASNSMQNISQDVVRNIWVPLPPLDEQHAIVEHIARETARLDSVRDATERTIALLKERRAALIAAAVTGQIDVMKNQPGKVAA